MAIGLYQHSLAVTRAGIAIFNDRKDALPGLSAFFPKVTTRAKQVSIAVKRNKQLIAVDVKPGGDPNRVTANNWTEKLWEPPEYRLLVDFKSIQGFEATFGAGLAPNAQAVDIIANGLADQLMDMKNMIIRATELQRAQALKTGIVVLKNGDSIDYKRKAASTVVNAGADTWDNVGADIYGQLQTDINFIREEGLTSNENEFNLILGSQALKYMYANTALKANASFFNQIRLVDIHMPGDAPVTGFQAHGQISVGDARVNLWTYSGWYEDASGTKVKYIAPTQATLLGGDFEAATAYGGIDCVFDYGTANQSVQPIEADFNIYSYIDPLKKNWDVIVESRPLAVPVSIDRVVTRTVAAS